MITSVKIPFPALHNGQRMWRLQWGDSEFASGYRPTKCSYYYVEQWEALAVYIAMKAGESFEAAHSQLVTKWTSSN